MTLRTFMAFIKGIVILIAGFAIMAASASSYAQEQNSRLGIKPDSMAGSYFILTMAPGEIRELTVELGNFGPQKVRARTYAADVYTIINGGFAATLDGEPTSGVTSWLDYPAETLELEPRTAINRTFKITIPADTRPGEYITSLAIQSADPEAGTSSGSIALKQTVRQVIAVAIMVPGTQIPGLEVGTLTYRTVAGQSLIAVEVKNTGNVHLKPTGEFTLYTVSGSEVSRYPLAMDTIYAGMKTFIEVPFKGRINAGDYTVKLVLADTTQHVQATASLLPLSVPPLEAEAASAPIGIVPQSAVIHQSTIAPALSAGTIVGLALSGLCLALALLGGYIYWQRRRTQP